MVGDPVGSCAETNWTFLYQNTGFELFWKIDDILRERRGDAEETKLVWQQNVQYAGSVRDGFV